MTRGHRRADGSLRPTYRRHRARKARRRRKEWLANFKPGDRDRFFRHVVLEQAVFLAAFKAQTGLPRAEAAELLERTADERRWRKLRTLDGTVVGIAPPTCDVHGCEKPAGEAVVTGFAAGVEHDLRVCDGHADLIRIGTLTGVSIGMDGPELRETPTCAANRVIRRRLDDGRILTVYPEITGTACIAIDDNEYVRGDTTWDRYLTEHGGERELRDSDGGYDFYFQYRSLDDAVAAFLAMTADDREPSGWHRAAPPRFRRRPDGDPAREYVAP